MNLSTIFIILVCLLQLLFTCSSVTKNTVGLARARSSLPKIEAYKERIQQKAGSVLVTNSITASTDKPPLSSYSYTRILPVLPSELPKFFALSFMMFWIIYIFTIARDTKDALIVTNCGAEAIAFLKVYGVVPAATAFMFGYAYLANQFSPRALFYITITPFMLFYALFAFVLYPMRHILHPMGLKVPEGGMSFAVNLLRHWTFSLYYIVSELWGSAGVPLLFWSCANDVIRIDQAKRIYPLIALVGNLGPIFSGITMTVVSRYVSRYVNSDNFCLPGDIRNIVVGNDEKAFEVSLKVLAVLTTIAGASVCALYNLVHRLNDADMKAEQEQDYDRNRKNEMKINKSHIRDESLSATHQVFTATAATSASPPTSTATVKTSTAVPNRKPSLSLSQSLAVLAQSPYLRHVASMVLAYGLSMEFTEILWKSSVKAAFPIKTDYLQFMGRYSTLVGCTAFVMMFVGSSVVDALGWRAGALVTPVMMGVLALPFFGCVIFGRLSPDTLLPAVYIGLAQNVLSKATKYAIFDPTKEMTYIPLDKQSKTQGKAAIDVLGARLGKSGGALVQQVLVLLFGSILQGAPLVAVLFYAALALWIGAVNELSPLFTRLTAGTDKEDTVGNVTSSLT